VVVVTEVVAAEVVAMNAMSAVRLVTLPVNALVAEVVVVVVVDVVEGNLNGLLPVVGGVDLVGSLFLFLFFRL
jgi:hypothetical protein